LASISLDFVFALRIITPPIPRSSYQIPDSFLSQKVHSKTMVKLAHLTSHFTAFHFPWLSLLLTAHSLLPTFSLLTLRSPLPSPHPQGPSIDSHRLSHFPFPISHFPFPISHFPSPIPPTPQTRYLSAVYVDPYPHPHHPIPSFLSRTATSGLNVLIYARRAEEGGDATGVI